MKILGVIAAGLAFSGCGGSTEPGNSTASGTMSCTVTQTTRTGSFSFTFTQCTESSGGSPDQIDATRRACNDSTLTLADGGVTQTKKFSDGLCSHENAIAGCRFSNGSVQAGIWWYRAEGGGLPMSDLTKICNSNGGQIVSP